MGKLNNYLSYIKIGLRELFWIAIAGVVIFGGIIGFRYLGENREVVEAAPIERPITLVETIELKIIDGALPIRGEGFIKPFRIANLASQVGGQVTNLHSSITERGTFKHGDVLVILDNSTERATLNQTLANIEGTQARLDLNEILLARTESLRESGTSSQAALDQVRSQREELSATLSSLKAAQNSAEVALDRKIVTAPFDGAVLNKSIEIGTVVSGGQAIAEIFTQDRMEIDVPIREVDAALIPGLFAGTFPLANVKVKFAGKVFTWNAHVSRVAPALDPRTRTLTLTVELDELTISGALDDNTLVSGAPPALINSFAKVVIKGTEPEATYPIPSTALRGGDKIWLFDQSDRDEPVLNIITADLVHVDGEISYVKIIDFPANSKLITTALSIPQNGMPLRDVQSKYKKESTEVEILELNLNE